MQWGGEFLSGDTHRFDWLPPSPLSQLSALPGRNSCFSPGLDLSLSADLREGWGDTLPALQEGSGCVFPQPPAVAKTSLCAKGGPGKPDPGGQGKEGQSHGGGHAICEGPQLRAESANGRPSRPLQLIVEAAGGRRAFRALLRVILSFFFISSLVLRPPTEA